MPREPRLLLGSNVDLKKLRIGIKKSNRFKGDDRYYVTLNGIPTFIPQSKSDAQKQADALRRVRKKKLNKMRK